MSYRLTIKRAYWFVLITVTSVPMSHAQLLSALSFTDTQLKDAGWTQSQIAELRATAPKERSMPAEKKEIETNEFSFSSVFENYHSYDDLPELDWIEANKEVGKIGGWRAYAKQVQDAQKLERENKGDDK